MSYKNRILDWLADHDGEAGTDLCIVRVNRTRYISGMPYFTTGFRERAYVFSCPEKVHEFCKLAGQDVYEIISVGASDGDEYDARQFGKTNND